ncbi:MAG: shikimate kinase [Nitrososphaeria archaeon]|nr:shikimate kinase [Nitrososphaeria archaeon]NDB51333.1 shikimate kinase [Nitrosopumilaceae archaeon]NDB45910.1 shikimate kinase [Nitrososphaeria archaeon]NDB91776.1 shikimate kinase [Nitrososphaeria archaeon]NDF29196.1 shikimate kinase [Nitrososphaeria archaeon]
MKVKATVNGAISIVNAIATWKGATLGISSKVEATVSATEGKGIILELDNQNMSSRLVNKVVEFAVPKKELEKNKIEIQLKSEIPTGYGLKSSSAISSVISLACHKLFKPNYTDNSVLYAGIDASLATKVSMTGAFDDACACYFGGIQVTDNKTRKIIKSDKIPTSLAAVVFVPKSRKRGNIKQLKVLETIFDRAWSFAKTGDYWNAMTLNGYATSAVLNSDPKIISALIENGALGASVSGNGPSIAAIVKKDNTSKIKKVFSEYEGTAMVAEINNKRAEVHEV